MTSINLIKCYEGISGLVLQLDSNDQTKSPDVLDLSAIFLFRVYLET